MKVCVVGTSGCGKSTFAARLARGLGTEHTELDALLWNDDWRESSEAEIREQVERVLAEEIWVIDGNYRPGQGIRERVFREADVIVWLDLPRRIVWWRLLKRSVGRAITRERLWGTNNRESFRLTFLSKDSVLLWSIRTFGSRRRMYEELMDREECVATKMQRVRTARESERVLRELVEAAVSGG